MPNPNFQNQTNKPSSQNSQLTLPYNFQPQPLQLFSSKSRQHKINVDPLGCCISSNGYNANNGIKKNRSVREWIELASETISTAFPLWVTIGCVFGLLRPSSFNWVTPNLCTLGLAIVMLGMGMTLTIHDLRAALSMPKEVLSGFFLQYSIMTPFLTAKLAGKYVAMDAAGLLISTLQVVLFPVLAGALLVQYFQPFVKFISPLMPPLAVATAAMLSGNAIAQSSSSILMSCGQVILASSLLHASGFFFGYILARMLGLDVSSSRTISIENAALGVVLATKHFGDPLTTVPCAVSSVIHSIFGSILAGMWRRSLPAKMKD